jgi:hypothetical protein
MTTKRRFDAKEQTIYRDLRNIITAMGATSLKVNQDIFEGDVEIIFDRAGKRYKFENSNYKHPLDNLRAAQLTFTYLWRALVEYGTAQAIEALSEQQLDVLFDRFFIGFTPGPDDTALLLGSGLADWWDVLGVPREANRQAVVNSFRALTKVHHPDNGGKAEDFRRLRTAYEEALKCLN